MRRFTTPTLPMTVPVDLTGADVRVTIKQSQRVMQKSGAEVASAYNSETGKTELSVTLTPTEIKTLLGENRIYADAGDVTVEYRVDFNETGLMYIPKAPTADGSYRLTADVTGGTPTYRWEATE